MYYMYLVARHSGNDEFNAAYAQEDGGSFTSDAFIWAGEKIQDWVEKGYFNEGYNSLTTDNGEDRALLYNNTCAMMLQGSWNVRNFVNDSQEWTDANLGVFRFPEDSPSLRITIFIILIISSHINNKQNLAGAEIGGIKMHAAIDVIIRRNHFHHCTRGLWLDWQAQGTRVTQNLFHDNTLPNEENANPEGMDGIGEDIFIEISHGPTLVDNNVLLSDRAMKLATQGVAVVHNLIAGSFTAVGRGVNNGSDKLPSPRYTPYHVPHRTEINGFMTVLHGDCRFYNNIFIQKPVRAGMEEIRKLTGDNEWDDGNLTAGTVPYSGYPTLEEYVARFEGYCGMGSGKSPDLYYEKLPVWLGGNVYFNGAKPAEQEQDAVVDTEHEITIGVKEENGKWKLETNVYDYLPQNACAVISTETLGMAFEPEQKYENPDGTPIVFRYDYFGNRQGIHPLPGPFASKEAAEEALS